MDFLKFDYLKYRKLYLSISAILILISVYFLFFWKLNLSIDMTWWVNIEYSYKNSLDLDKLKSEFEKEKESLTFKGNKVINNVNIYSTTGKKDITLITWFNDISDEKELDKIKANFRAKALEIIKSADNTAEELNYTNIWKTFWDYIKNTAYLTLFLAMIWMFVYIYYAFSWSVSWIAWFYFWIVTVLALFHDIIISTWVYIFVWMFYSDFQIDIYFITALLTILWYSINDTIVIFDRIRENLKMFAWKEWKNWKNLYEIINLSVLETFKRSIYTSVTLVFVLVTILVFWPKSLQGFIFVMLVWTIIWTYSSIFIASPILYEMNKNKKLTVYKKKIYNPEDKIVV